MSEGHVCTMPEWLHWRAQATSGRLALIAGGRRLSFAELAAEADRMARRLAALGPVPGDRLATLLPNGLEAAVVPHVVSRLGLVLVPLNVRLAPGELAWQLADCGARWLLAAPPTLELARQAVERVAGCRLIATEPLDPGVPALDELPEAAAPLRRAIDLGQVHTVVYTSGTTGRPKGALLTYGNHWWSALGSAMNLGALPGDCWLICLPLFHVGGLSILFRSVISGFAALVHERFDPEAVNRAIDEEGVTLLSVVSTMLWRMLEARGERPYPATLRCVLLGGGPAPRPLLEACARLGLPVAQTYGLTETASQVATLAPEDALRKLGSAGKPLYPNQVRIVTEEGQEAQPGEVGEILVRGPVVTPGYLNRPEATAAALRDGWLRTGDLGYLDAEGYLSVVERREDLIVSGGENVYPAEVEAALLAHPAVAEAVVVGVPDPEWGQRVVAAVRLAAGATVSAAELQAWCRERLAGYKVPKEIRLVTELPRNATGKLLRRAVREWWETPGA
jgi:O-succinylbenzoic acid--CoA ligase